MDVKTFATELARSLTKRGIKKELAVKHAVSLVRTFDEDDLREITAYTSCEDFSDLSDSLADLIKEKDTSSAAEKEAEIPARIDPPEDTKIATGEIQLPKTTDYGARLSDTQTVPVIHTQKFTPIRESAAPVEDENMKTKAIGIVRDPMADNMKTRVVGIPTDPDVDNMKTRVVDIIKETADNDESSESTRTFVAVKDGAAEEKKKSPRDWTEDDDGFDGAVVDVIYDEKSDQEIYLEDEEQDENKKVKLTKRGKGFFWSIAIGTSPLTFTCALAVLAVFALGIVTVCALIVACLLLVCAEAVCGSGLTLIGVIYGVIQMLEGNTATGLFELGLGIASGGAFLALGILTYNFAVLVLPYGLKQLLTFEGYCLKRVGPMINRFREECNRL